MRIHEGIWWLGEQLLMLSLSVRNASAKEKKTCRREVAGMKQNIDDYLEHWRSEEQMLDARLARRYDPGMALNESFARAIEAKKAAKSTADGALLTSVQQKALAVQRQTLERILNNSGKSH